MSTPTPTLQGLSRDVTLAVLSRLYTEELMLELSRRNINMGGHSINKVLLVCVLRDVMTKEYRDSESDKNAPHDDTVDMSIQCFDDSELAEQEEVQTRTLQKYSEKLSRICPSSHEGKSSSDGGNKDATTSKESGNSEAFTSTSSSMIANNQTTIATPCVNGATSKTASKDAPVATLQPESEVGGSYATQNIKQEVEEEEVTLIGSFNVPSKQDTGTLDVATTSGSSNSYHSEFNIDSTTFSTHVLDIDGPGSNSEERALASQLIPDHSDVRRWECRPSDNDGVAQIYQQPNLEHFETYTENGDVLFSKSGANRSNVNGTSAISNVQRDRPRNFQTAENVASRISERGIPDDYKGPYTCTICGFKSAYGLSNHMKRHKRSGDKEKPFMCGECGYRADGKSKLADHMRKHTGEKPFKCDRCDFKAAYKRQLNVHLRKPHYSCEICDYTTYLKAKLKTHMKGHRMRTYYDNVQI
ncbi:uncharacterized protein LOC144907045 [Branchiostoma floridae x Branchiostoma belcheri]